MRHQQLDPVKPPTRYRYRPQTSPVKVLLLDRAWHEANENVLRLTDDALVP